MAKLISPDALVSEKAVLEDPVRVFAFAGIQAGAVVGRYSIINRQAYVQGGVTIGRYCNIARAVDLGTVQQRTDLLSTHPFQYSKAYFGSVPGYAKLKRTLKNKTGKTVIGHDVSIGSQAIVAAGVTIGTGAVIGAGSIVIEDVPPYAIVDGAPATVVEYRFDKLTVVKLLASNWWELTPGELEGVSFDKIDKALEQIATRRAQKTKSGTTGLKQATKAEEDRRAAELEGHPFIEGLRQSLREMMVPDEVMDLALNNAADVAEMFDPLDPGDQEILRNKLAYLSDFLANRDDDDLSVNEQRHVASLFRHKQ